MLHGAAHPRPNHNHPCRLRARPLVTLLQIVTARGFCLPRGRDALRVADEHRRQNARRGRREPDTSIGQPGPAQIQQQATRRADQTKSSRVVAVEPAYGAAAGIWHDQLRDREPRHEDVHVLRDLILAPHHVWSQGEGIGKGFLIVGMVDRLPDASKGLRTGFGAMSATRAKNGPDEMPAVAPNPSPIASTIGNDATKAKPTDDTACPIKVISKLSKHCQAQALQQRCGGARRAASTRPARAASRPCR